MFSFVQTHHDMPIFCMGDMNEIMHPNEKHGPGRPDMCRINIFCNLVKHCDFLDLGYSGPAYTWNNKRFTSSPTFQRLDRCFANVEWCMIYPCTSVFHLPMLNSDHAPILTLLDSHKRNTIKPFRFENW